MKHLHELPEDDRLRNVALRALGRSRAIPTTASATTGRSTSTSSFNDLLTSRPITTDTIYTCE
jgi:hypothetical protein